MLTVKHICHGCIKSEKIYEVKTVQRISQEPGSGSTGPQPWTGVRILLSNNDELEYPDYNTTSISVRDTFYVMNESGKTVATYEL